MCIPSNIGSFGSDWMHVSSFIFVTLNSHPTQGCATMFFCEKSIPHNSRNPKFLTVYIGTNKCVSLNKKKVQFVLKSAKIRKIHIGLKPSLRKKTMNRFPVQKMFANKKVGNLLVKFSFSEKATTICAMFWHLLSKRQNHKEDGANFSGLLRKAELLSQNFSLVRQNKKLN